MSYIWFYRQLSSQHLREEIVTNKANIEQTIKQLPPDRILKVFQQNTTSTKPYHNSFENVFLIRTNNFLCDGNERINAIVSFLHTLATNNYDNK